MSFICPCVTPRQQTNNVTQNSWRIATPTTNIVNQKTHRQIYLSVLITTTARKFCTPTCLSCLVVFLGVFFISHCFFFLCFVGEFHMLLRPFCCVLGGNQSCFLGAQNPQKLHLFCNPPFIVNKRVPFRLQLNTNANKFTKQNKI